jgi:hypothetical protein
VYANAWKLKVLMPFFLFFFFLLAPGVQSFTPTNPEGAQALSKEFPVSVPRLNQGANPQSDRPKK